MAKLRLTLACTATDRTRPVLDGRVTVPGVEFTFLPGEPEDIFRRTLRDKAFDVAELSMGSHIVTTARGDSAYIGVPAFLSRAFRHSAIHVRTDRGITRPEDLAGRTIALPEYQQTAALWVRGILRESHGVDTRAIRWRIGSERIAVTLPEGFDVAPLGAVPEEALRAGTVDALFTPRPPAPHPQIAPLFPDSEAAERAWFAQTGFFPIMHALTLRRELAEEHPWLPVELFRAFTRARNIAVAELPLNNVLRVSMPWIADAFRAQTKAMGGDPWPYGFGRNRAEIAAMIRFARHDGLALRDVEPEELFHPSTLTETA
ncbi:MAG: ABC transporter substrate-binding protein [Acetobacteraceae bacterium]|nr:ABC transporter substrate-binding protein [Acetobacteraceae bacterium]